MQLGTTLGYMYPGEPTPPTNYEVVSGGITYWNAVVLGPRPTDQQLADVWIPALKAQKIAEVRRRVVSECEGLMPVYEVLYCVRARIVDPRLTQLDTIAKKGRDMETRVNAAATEADLLAVVW